MADGVKINLDKDLIEMLDKFRGDLEREEFIVRIIQEHLAKKSNNIKSNDTGDEFINLDPENENYDPRLDNFFSSFKKFTSNVYERLDRLENLMADLPLNMKTDDSVNSKTDSVIFELDESNDEDFDVEEASEEDSETEETTHDDAEFEYGCPFCNATIAEDAKECPRCGNKFDTGPGVEYGLDRNRRESPDAMVVEPLSEGYSSSGEYDPRPRYMKRYNSSHEPKRSDMEQITPPPASHLSYGNKREMCSICGERLSYIEEYKRWYCYTCKKYAGVPVKEPSLPVNNLEQKSRQYPEKPTMSNPPPSTTTKPKFIPPDGRIKPLKNYPEYRD